MKYQLIDEEKVIIRRLNEMEYPIYIYGTGEAAAGLTRFINGRGFSITAYCVNAEYYQAGTIFQSKPVILTKDLKRLKTDYHLFLGIENLALMKKVILENPFAHDLYLSFDYVRMWQPDQEFCDTYKQRLSYLNEVLADSFSCETLWSWLDSKITGKVKAHLPYCAEGQYFNSLTDVRGGGIC